MNKSGSVSKTKEHVCPIDKRRFSTKAALAQHRRDAHPNGNRGKSNGSIRKSSGVPVARTMRESFGYRSTSSVNAMTAEGTDVLVTVSVPMSATAGVMVAAFQVNPRLLDGTRLSENAKMWQRWHPDSLRVRVSTNLPSLAGGQLALAWTADYRESVSGSATEKLRKIMSMQPNSIFQGWEGGQINIPSVTSQPWLFCDSEFAEDSYHGVVFLLLAAPPLGLANSGSWSCTLLIDWRIRFNNPDLPSVAGPSALVMADEGYYPYYTTGSNHLTVTDRLTMEENSAGGYGSIVRFSDMIPGEVYVPDKKDQLKYLKSDKTEDNVGALVRMKEVADPLAWCFSSVTAAKTYIEKGDVSLILKYYAAGPWCTGNPVWKASDEAALWEPRGHKPVHSSGPVRLLVSESNSRRIYDLQARRDRQSPYGSGTSPIVVVTPGVQSSESVEGSLEQISLEDLRL